VTWFVSTPEIVFVVFLVCAAFVWIVFKTTELFMRILHIPDNSYRWLFVVVPVTLAYGAAATWLLRVI
jgi:hypothetical protein